MNLCTCQAAVVGVNSNCLPVCIAIVVIYIGKALAIVECLFADIFYGSGDCNGCNAFTLIEHKSADSYYTFGNNDFFDGITTQIPRSILVISICFYCRIAVITQCTVTLCQSNLFDFGTTRESECAVENSCCSGHCKIFYSGTAPERLVADESNGIGNNNRCKCRTLIECAVTDSCNTLGNRVRCTRVTCRIADKKLFALVKQNASLIA